MDTGFVCPANDQWFLFDVSAYRLLIHDCVEKASSYFEIINIYDCKQEHQSNRTNIAWDEVFIPTIAALSVNRVYR